jgi:hypothetical protein
VPGTFKTVEEQVLVRAASKRLEVVPAVYEDVTEQVKISDAVTTWKRGRAWIAQAKEVSSVAAYTQAVAAGRTPAGVKTGAGSGVGTVAGGGSAGTLFGDDDDIMCLVEIPAQYKTITKRVIKTPASTREIEIPADYATIKKQVIDTQAATREVSVAGASSTYTRRVVDMDALLKQGYKLSADGNTLTDAAGNTMIPVYDLGAEKSSTAGNGGRSTGNRRADAGASGSSIIGYNREVTIPAEYKTVARQVVDTPATTREVTIPAEFRTVKRQVVDTPASTREIDVPGEFATVARQVVDTPASQRTIPIPAEFKTVSRQVIDQPASTREIEIPAEYKTVTRQVVDVPASTREIEVPAEYRTVKRQVVDKPASVREIDVPAEYKTVRVQKVIEQAQERAVDIPAQMGTVTSTKKVSDGAWGWRSILCETNATPTKIQEIQRALKQAGYDPGPIDGVIKQATMRAVNSYQEAKGLPVDPYLNVETVKSLGVSPI